jgi:hypothetical protein
MHKKIIRCTFIILPTLYLGIPIFIYALALVISNYCYVNNDKFTALSFFFIYMYLLPFGMHDMVLEYSWGGLVGNSMIASLPMYFMLLKFKESDKMERTLKLIFSLFVLSFILSTLIPGLKSMLGLGGNIRLSTAVDFINYLLVSVFAYYAINSKMRINEFLDLIIKLGLICAVLGLLQYTLKFYFFKNTYAYKYFERLTIVPHVDPVDMFPFFIVPFCFAFTKLLTKQFGQIKLPLISFIVLSSAALFSFARWGLFCLFVAVIFNLLLNKRYKLVFVIISITVIMFTLSTDTILLSYVPQHQQERLSSDTNFLLRVNLWGMGLTALSKNLLFGVGLSQGAYAAFAEQNEFSFVALPEYAFNYETVQSIHSFFIDWVLCMGVIVLPAILMLYYFTIKNFKKVLSTLKEGIEVSYAKAAVVALITLTLFWTQNSGDTFYWLFLFLSTSYTLTKNVSHQHARVSVKQEVKNFIAPM